ncbi:Store-operated calcium entry-associated regulatory factor [Apodemus speciosus]|uniref:Store-operated calcium entry-associated regulatory factor n=1 Tax=Apodemus speciosus TaxID=105296 RepID=A0ABQ0F1C0_APOSI
MTVAAVGRPRAVRCPLLLLLSFLLGAGPALCWNDPDRILLRDVKALTLYSDRYTTSRRLAPIPQLKCVGGTAGCDAYSPKVIQCQNQGWDGYDVQWECKTDLDIAYKFGKTVVSCEGYESSEDQYVLRGSCGLEYHLDYTELGLKQLKESGKHQGFSDYYRKLSSSDSCGLVTIAVLFALAFVVYKLFLSDSQGSPPPYSEHPPYSQGFASAAGAPPPGFKSEFTGDHRVLAMVRALASGVLSEAKAMAAQGQGSGLAWVLEDCSGICLAAATGRRPLSQTHGTIQPTPLPTPAPGTAGSTHHWEEAQGATVHPPVQTREPEQRQGYGGTKRR